METQQTTVNCFNKVLDECLTILKEKNKDYGHSWKILRPSSLTDQIYIKAYRIRTIQETKENAVGEPIDADFKGIINYCLMALYNLERREVKEAKKEIEMERFSFIISEIKKLLEKKDHDYGGAWRELRVSSIIDLILQKLFRLRQIENNDYEVSKFSEQAFASYQDIVNYSVFALVHISEGVDPMK